MERVGKALENLFWLDFSQHCGEAVGMAPISSSVDGVLVDSSSSSSFPRVGGIDLWAILALVAVILWL